MYKKTIIFINFRFGGFYSSELLKQVKNSENCRIVAVVDDYFQQHIPHDFKEDLDELYSLSPALKYGFLHEFDYDDLKAILQKEQTLNPQSTISLVCTDEFNLLSVGRLRDEFGLAGGMGFNDLLKCRDKGMMKTVLSDSKIRVPRFMRLDRRVMAIEDDGEKIYRQIATILKTELSRFLLNDHSHYPVKQ